MSRPYKHPKTGVYYFRKRVPADLITLAGKKVEYFSLRTKEPAEARRRYADALDRIERKWALLRTGPEPLSQRQIMGLAGILYAELTADLADEPGSEATWSHVLRLHREAREAGKLEQWVGASADELLAKQGLRTDDHSRARLIKAVDGAFMQAAGQLQRNAQGDYTADPQAARFPAWEPVKAAADTFQGDRKGNGKVTLTGLLEGWWREAQSAGRSPRTLESYSGTIKRLVAFLGHDDATRLTPENVLAYKDHRLAHVDPRTGQTLSAKTIKDSDLAALKSVLGWAKNNLRIPTNPAEGLTMKVGKRKLTRPPGFTDAEAGQILNAALTIRRGEDTERTHAAKRWVPWLLAYTGARVGEMGQLRREDVRQEASVWTVTITPDAGPVKNSEVRTVPLHEHVVALGFLDFVRGSPPGPLFVKPDASGDVRGPLRGLANRLQVFVRDDAGVTDEAVQPNHGWRHRFAAVQRRLGTNKTVIQHILGHAKADAHDGYSPEGDVEAMAVVINRIPRIVVKGDPTEAP